MHINKPPFRTISSLWLPLFCAVMLSGCGGSLYADSRVHRVYDGVAIKSKSADNAELYLVPEPDFNFSHIIYIDNQLSRDCVDYDVASRRCGRGEQLAFATIAGAAASAAPGVNFQLRGGDYREMLHVTTSGRADAYLGYSAYQNEVITLVNVDSWDKGQAYGALWLDQVSYVLIDGIDVHGSVGFGRLLNAHYNVISNGEFSDSRLMASGNTASKRGGLYIAFSDYNRILNNRFYRGTDALALVHSNHNLVADNRIDLAGHDVWSIKCGNFNVIRNNEFSNKQQKIGSLFDCESATMSWHGNGRFARDDTVVDQTQHNLIDSNIFRDALNYYSTSGGNGIQYAGQRGIIRRNLFYRTNVGLGMQGYSEEAKYNYGNRIYHNVFHNNWCAGLNTANAVVKMTDNRYLNNILWNNQGSGANNCAAVNAKQILWQASNNGGDYFINNNIASARGDEILGSWGAEIGYDIDDYAFFIDAIQFTGNLQQNPEFVDEDAGNYRLRAASPMLDAGAYFTQVTSASGTGNRLELDDVSYFYDGFGIPGEVGDRIQIAGQTDTAIIVKIDYHNSSIFVDKPLTWKQGDGIALSYTGAAPDLGAFER